MRPRQPIFPHTPRNANHASDTAEGDASRADPKANEGSISTGHGKDVSETCPKLPKIGVDVERQNSWAQQVHESEVSHASRIPS